MQYEQDPDTLAKSDPTIPANAKFAENLQAQIQDEAGEYLADIWSGLEGNGALGTRSVINEWANAVGPGPGAPTFANVSYLSSAVPNLQYYQGAMLVGYNLQIELAHALEVQGSDLAPGLINQASADFEENEDALMKLVAQNQQIGSGPTGLYAAVLPPFFAAAVPPGGPKKPNVYNAAPTNAWNWAIDTRSGLMWMRSRSCDGSSDGSSNCTFAMYDKEGGFGSGVELVQPYLSTINTTLSNSYPGELLAMTAPGRAQWISFLSGLYTNNNNNPSNTLASIYFFGQPTAKLKPFSPAGTPDYTHFWTSDVYQEAPGPRVFPAWCNWHVDTSVSAFGNCEPTENLELVSAAPLADPYHFLYYRSHQDDFSMNVFTAGPSMKVARADATATPLLNGKVLIAGGQTSGNRGAPVAARSTELYDPATDRFAAGPPMNAIRTLATATLLPNGRVLIAGGYAFPNPVETVAGTELYDPGSNTFAAAAATPAMNVARAAATATLLPDGKVLIAGGSNYVLGTGLTSAELYDPYANTFTPAAFTPVMNAGRSFATATLLPNGKVLIAGGVGSDPKDALPLKSTELYDSLTNSFAPAASTPTMHTPRMDATATLLPNGKVLIAGGNEARYITDPNSVRPLKTAELYDPATNTFADTSSPMVAARFLATATLLPNGKVLIAGGVGEHGQVLDSTELYDPATDSFTASSPMRGARDGATAAVLPDSQVLIVGGQATVTPVAPVHVLSSTDLYTE
ncbi:MAG TPA: kelch repeat-containing protein [Stellaceae bacterium]|jgi:hypothetical protein